MSPIQTTERVRIPVSINLTDQRLDVSLVVAGIIATRSQGQKLIHDGMVRVNGKVVKPSYRLQNGETIEVELQQRPDLELVPYDFPLDIVFEDDDVLVINKPAGLVVHPACGHTSDTLVNALVSYNKQLSAGSDRFRPGLVHRLDKDTSGLIVLAKNEHSHNSLARQFHNKTIHRRYWAVCFDEFKVPAGRIHSFIARDEAHRKRFASNHDNRGKEAITHYQVRQFNSGLSLVELRLETGRTHQIRVHLSSLNHPIVGDDLYNGRNRAHNLKSLKLRNLLLQMPRFALHAKELGFVHPRLQQQLKFNSKIPPDLHELFNLCDWPIDE